MLAMKFLLRCATTSSNPDLVGQWAITVPQIFRCGDLADAEQAVLGWRMWVDNLFEPPE